MFSLTFFGEWPWWARKQNKVTEKISTVCVCGWTCVMWTIILVNAVFEVPIIYTKYKYNKIKKQGHVELQLRPGNCYILHLTFIWYCHWRRWNAKRAHLWMKTLSKYFQGIWPPKIIGSVSHVYSLMLRCLYFEAEWFRERVSSPLELWDHYNRTSIPTHSAYWISTMNWRIFRHCLIHYNTY